MKYVCYWSEQYVVLKTYALSLLVSPNFNEFPYFDRYNYVITNVSSHQFSPNGFTLWVVTLMFVPTRSKFADLRKCFEWKTKFAPSFQLNKLSKSAHK